MIDFDNPLDQDFLDDIGKSKREVLGDAITQPKQFIIGRLNDDGTITTDVVDDEYNRVWVRQPGEDAGDAVQAINTYLRKDEITRDRPVRVKQTGNSFEIIGNAPESADYDAQLPTAPQKPINRGQYNLASVTPSMPDTSFYAYYRGGIFQLNNEAYRITDRPSSDFSGDVPGSNAISIKVELDPTDSTWYETTGGAFTFTTLEQALKDGDLNTTRTDGRFLIGWIRLYDGQTSIELQDILIAEHMLDLIDDHGALVGLGDDDHTQYIHKTPGSDDRNTIQPTGDFNPLSAKSSGGTLLWYFEQNGDFITNAADTSNTVLGKDVGRSPASGWWNTFIGELAGSDFGSVGNTFVGYSAGRSLADGGDNVGIGIFALDTNTDGDSNVGVGNNALFDNTTGSENVAGGHDSLQNNTSGNNNTALGYDAGGANLTGHRNVFLGHSSGSTATGNSDELYIHNARSSTPIIYGDFATGFLGLTQGTPATRLHINGALTIDELSADPDAVLEGDAVIWKSDGTDTGDDGDLLYSEQSGGVTDTGSLKWKDFVPSSVTLNTGTSSSNVTDAQVMFDGNTYDIAEVTGVPGFDAEFNFTGLDRCVTMVVCRWQYDGSSTHFVTIDMWNYITTAWDQIRVFSNSNAFFASMTMYIPLVNQPNYVDGSGNAMIRFYHNTSGNASHDIHIDYVGITHGLQGVL